MLIDPVITPASVSKRFWKSAGRSEEKQRGTCSKLLYTQTHYHPFLAFNKYPSHKEPPKAALGSTVSSSLITSPKFPNPSIPYQTKVNNGKSYLPHLCSVKLHYINIVKKAEAGLPPGWEVRHSNSKNLPYYFNEAEKLSRWEPPQGTDTEKLKAYMATHHSAPAIRPESSSNGVTHEGKIRASHLLVKHRDSRRPSSWREVSFKLISIPIYHTNAYIYDVFFSGYRLE